MKEKIKSVLPTANVFDPASLQVVLLFRCSMCACRQCCSDSLADIPQPLVTAVSVLRVTCPTREML